MLVESLSSKLFVKKYSLKLANTIWDVIFISFVFWFLLTNFYQFFITTILNWYEYDGNLKKLSSKYAHLILMILGGLLSWVLVLVVPVLLIIYFVKFNSKRRYFSYLSGSLKRNFYQILFIHSAQLIQRIFISVLIMIKIANPSVSGLLFILIPF